ncbi:MAG: response regulator [Treponema sp.]|jgi:signal transduction histidine kinase/CheY-like chemotaxis protein|nr:response regulator [Treponema sp.]
MMILYCLPAAFTLALAVGLYALYDNRKALKSNLVIYLFSAVSMIWTASVWISYMDFAPALRRTGLFVAEAAASGLLAVVAGAFAKIGKKIKICVYGARILIAFYFIFLVFHCLGFFVSPEIQDGKLVIVSGKNIVFYAYLAYHAAVMLFCCASTFIIAYKSGYKREKLTAFLICPVYFIGLYLFLLRFADPSSRLAGCLTQTAALVFFYIFFRKFNVRIVSEPQMAELTFSRFGGAYLFADEKGDIFYANKGALAFFNAGLEKLQNKNIGNLFTFKDSPLPFSRRRNQMRANECRAQALNNSALCRISFFYKWDSWDELICVIIRVDDITEQEQLIRQLEQARLRAEDAARAKNIFLANTSHEIRTPMNAILGMVELILRQKISRNVYEHAMGIKQAGTSLLTIINDVLDFSKIESGKLDIVPSEYRFSSLIDDCVRIIRMRIAEKPLLFIANFDAKLPDKLSGDAVRVRQVMINILANAVKYTREGHIIFSITGRIPLACDIPPPAAGPKDSAGPPARGAGGQVVLKVEISDTGVGIKKENIDRLFEEFQRLDSHREHSIEGTGLGLAISRGLCQQMGGDIVVRSEYGKGSVFTALIPQMILENTPIARVHNPESKPVLLYEKRDVYKDSLIASFQSLDVPVKAAADLDAFFQELKTGQYAYAFVSASFAGRAIDCLHTLEKPAVPVILAERGESPASQEVPVLNMPAHVISIANVLNNKQQADSPEKTTVRFIAPDARILIVDDIQINLIVAQGLLSLYRMDIHTAISGARAIEMVSRRSYDLILMDHMMPEMDGIETAKAIRALDRSYARSIPIVALTANAVSGMKEMFLKNGFNDFLSKPIEIPKLDEIVTKWIPGAKKKDPGEWEDARAKLDETAFGGPPASGTLAAIEIEGVDVSRGIAMTGGSEEGYRNVLSVLHKDIQSRVPVFEKLIERPEDSPLPPEELPAFTIHVHALKSALATIGASELSEKAAGLESAGKGIDCRYIAIKLPAFIRDLKALNEKIKAAVILPEETQQNVRDIASLLPALEELQAALLAYDVGRIDALMKQLEAEGRPALNETARLPELILMGDYEEAAELIGELLLQNQKNG